MNEKPWISVIERLPSETTVCEVRTAFGYNYQNVFLCNGVWADAGNPVEVVDMVSHWREMPTEPHP